MSAKKELVQTLAKSGVSPEQTPCMNAAAILEVHTRRPQRKLGLARVHIRSLQMHPKGPQQA